MNAEAGANPTIRRTGFNVFPLELRTEERAPYLRALGVSEPGVPHLLRRMDAMCLRVEGLDARAASILKQDLLSVGGDVALPDTVSRFVPGPVNALLMGTRREFGYLVKGLKAQPYGLKGLSAEIEACLRGMDRPGTLLVNGVDLLEGPALPPHGRGQPDARLLLRRGPLPRPQSGHRAWPPHGRRGCPHPRPGSRIEPPRK